MKLLIIGSDDVWSIDKLYYKYIKEAGIEVELIPTLSYFLKYLNKSIFNRVIHRLALTDIYVKINQALKKKVEDFAPDVAWIFKGMEIVPQTIQWMKDRGISIINYNPDSPFIFTDKGSGNKNVTNSIRLYDLHFTYNHEVMQELEQKLHLRSAMLPFGFDISEETYSDCKSQEEIVKVCFIGTPDKKRVAFLKSLAEKGISYDVYGNDWNKVLKHPNVTVHKAVYGQEFWKVLRKYRVQLNLMRIHNEDSHNMRSFEVPAIGGIMVAPDTTEHRMYFEDKKEVFLYKDVSNCIEIIKNLLIIKKVDAEVIRTAARDRCLNSDYSYKSRANQALMHIDSLSKY